MSGVVVGLCVSDGGAWHVTRGVVGCQVWLWDRVCMLAVRGTGRLGPSCRMSGVVVGRLGVSDGGAWHPRCCGMPRAGGVRLAVSVGLVGRHLALVVSVFQADLDFCC